MFQTEHGGRYRLWFDEATPIISLWSKTTDDAVIIGNIHLERENPEPGAATLAWIEWDPADCGSEAVLWRALETLAGQSLRPSA